MAGQLELDGQDAPTSVGSRGQVGGDGGRFGRKGPEPLVPAPGDEDRPCVAVPLHGPLGAGLARVAGGALQWSEYR